MGKIEESIINFYLQSDEVHGFKTAIDYFINLYNNGAGFRTLANKINAAQSVQITPQGLRKYLITYGLKPQTARYLKKAPVKAVPEQTLSAASCTTCEEMTARYDRIKEAIQEQGHTIKKQNEHKNAEITRLSMIILDTIKKLTDAIDKDSITLIVQLREDLDKSFNTFS